MKNTVGCIFCLDKKDSCAGKNKRGCFSGNQILGGEDEYKEQDNSDVYSMVVFCFAMAMFAVTAVTPARAAEAEPLQVTEVQLL